MEGIADNSVAYLAYGGAGLARIAAVEAKTDAGSFRFRIDSCGSCGWASDSGAGQILANSEEGDEDVHPPPKNHQIVLRR